MLDPSVRDAIISLRDAEPQFIEFFKALASRQKNRSVTPLDKVLESAELTSLGSESQRRRAALEFFRQLASAGAGELRIGRRGKATRFIWKAPLLEVARLASPDGGPEREEGPNLVTQAPEESLLVTHTYLLRKNLTLKFQLPIDLTASEAERLAAMIRTLPLEGGETGEDA